MQQLGAVRIKPSSQHARPACRAAAVSLCTLPGLVRPQTWLSLKLLAIPIRMILFLCSFDFSSRVFFAWQVRVHVLVGCVARRFSCSAPLRFMTQALLCSCTEVNS